MITKGSLIKKFRLEKGLTVAKLAESVGCARQYLSKVESGDATPSKGLLGRIAKTLRLTQNEEEQLGIITTTMANPDTIKQEEKADTMKEDKITLETNLPGQGFQIEVSNSLQVMYTDLINLTWNEFGVTLDFGQRLGMTNKVNIVTRVGMSKKHAEAFSKLLDTELKKMKD